jgi:phage terminase small subunit
MTDMYLQRLTESLSYIGQAAEVEQDPCCKRINRSTVKLTPKEEAFCLAIVEGLRASDAYRRAYKPQRAQAKTIHEKASRLMAKGKVQARVAELMAPVIAEAQMTRTEWLQRLARCCRFDPRKMFDAHGKPKPITELEENEAAAIEQYELHAEIPTADDCRKAFRGKIKFLDRLSALALLGKACHWYADRREDATPDGAPIQKEIVVRFVRPSKSPEGDYRRMVTDT